MNVSHFRLEGSHQVDPIPSQNVTDAYCQYTALSFTLSLESELTLSTKVFLETIISILISLKITTVPLQGLAPHAFRIIWHLAKTRAREV